MDFPSYYLEHIDNLLVDGKTLTGNYDWNKSVHNALNSGPYKAIRENIPIYELREAGVFFTNEKIANQLSELTQSDSQKSYFDPACGVGDLLISCARRLSLFPTLSETLDAWADKLYGVDISSNFIHITKVRLALFALLRGAEFNIWNKSIDDYFPNISVGDSLSAVSYPNTNYVILNPPYSTSTVKKDWSQGKVSQAALFIEALSDKVKVGTVVLAVLPDVLRSGTRYKKWRNLISSKFQIDSLTILGRFDEQTDVDVFIVKLIKVDKLDKNNQWPDDTDKNAIGFVPLGDLFHVHVGAVVPHRDPESGEEYPYITAKDIPSWQIVEPQTVFRQFLGTTYEPPFVVVKRTSSPGDKYRASAAVIKGTRNIAVENHLIVIKPKDNSLEACTKLLDDLKSTGTNDWLNEKIRCRHLTVTILRRLPIRSK